MGKLLFICWLSQGHMSACMTVAKQLLDNYPEHMVYFNVDEEFEQKIQASNALFRPVLMKKLDQPDLPSAETLEERKERFRTNYMKIGLDRYKHSLVPIERIQEIFICAQDAIEAVIDRVQPDVILVDHLFNLPFVENKNVPWGLVVSANPLYAQNLPNYPPAMSGLSADEKKSGHLWQEYRLHKKKSPLCAKRRRWYEKCNVPLNEYLDQKELYPLVDVVVTHGGNNSYCEIFLLHRKPFVLVPFFGDQADNSTRINDLNLGIGMDWADLGRESLKKAIERVTTDDKMKQRMKEAAKMSEADNGLERFVDELHLYLSKQK